MNDRKNDPSEKLIQATGPRPAVPEETARKVRAAVHRHWRDTVEQNRRPNRVRTVITLAAAAIILLAVSLGVWNLFRPAGDSRSPFVVQAVSGTTSLAVGDTLEFGSDLTTPADGGLAIGAGPGQSVRLDSGTTVRLLASDSLTLSRGAVYVDSRSTGENSLPALTIGTLLGDFREIGTQFEIRLSEDTVRARVREGRITVEHAGEDLQVVAGQEMEINYRGELQHGTIDPASSEWGWIGELAPMMEIEGRPVGEFLDWIARERGLQLTFEDPALYVTAAETGLNGSIDGMSLDQALEAVLPTCGMTHHIQNGTLTLLRAD